MRFHPIQPALARALGRGLRCGAAAVLVLACDRNDPGIPAVEILGETDAVEFGPLRWRDETQAQVVVRMTGRGEPVEAVRYEFFQGDELIDQGIVPGNVLTEAGREVVRYWPMATTFHPSGRVNQISIADADRLVIHVVSEDPPRSDTEPFVPADNVRKNHSTRPLPR